VSISDSPVLTDLRPPALANGATDGGRSPLPLDWAALVAPDLLAVDGVIRERLVSSVPLINTVSAYIVSAGGKRLRPVILLLAAAALGNRSAARLELAAVVEFIHTATLLHDDVVDESALRRGRPTANASFGNAASVLVGDFLYSRAFQMMVSVGKPQVLPILSEATNIIAEGEVLQLMNMHQPDITREAYLQVIRFKTAKLFEASARLGAVVADASAEMEAACATYGRSLGTAFQLVDDLLDYEGSTAELGKNIGDDLREGKPTLPLIAAMERGSSAQRARIREAIEQGDVEHLAEIVDIVHSTGALEVTRQAAQAEVALATQAANALPACSERDALLELAAQSVGRRQ
jgi:octaprenyl-diphosphate synthase